MTSKLDDGCEKRYSETLMGTKYLSSDHLDVRSIVAGVCQIILASSRMALLIDNVTLLHLCRISNILCRAFWTCCKGIWRLSATLLNKS